MESNEKTGKPESEALECDFKYVVNAELGSVEITEYIGNQEKVHIPEKINSMPVTSIGKRAFFLCLDIKDIGLPECLISIGEECFLRCENLIDITIPESVKTIGSKAFSGCKLLESVTIPNQVRDIGFEPFESCSSLKTIILSDSNERVERTFLNREVFECIINSQRHSKFYGNDFYEILDSRIKEVPEIEFEYEIDAESGTVEITKYIGDAVIVVIPDKIIDMPVIGIGKEAFTQRSDLTEIFIPDCVTSIGDYAFSYCNSLKSIVIPDSVTTIKLGAFFNCKNLEKVALSNNVSTIEAGVFCACRSLADISIPERLTRIERRTFMSCKCLTNITLPENLTYIGEEAFNGSEQLIISAIPDTVAKIEKNAFDGCSELSNEVVAIITQIERRDDGEKKNLKYEQLKIGDIIPFGKHEWLVLDIQSDKLLILSKNILQTRVYHNDCDDEARPVETTWEYCSLRNYLNTEFYNEYSRADQEKIVETRIKNQENIWYGVNCGSITDDKIFLLSLEEVDHYFGNSGDYQNKVRVDWENNIAVESTIGRHFSNDYDDIRIAKTEKSNKIWWWWLRTNGYDNKHAAGVDLNGSVNVFGFRTRPTYSPQTGGLRPALWLKPDMSSQVYQMQQIAAPASACETTEKDFIYKEYITEQGVEVVIEKYIGRLFNVRIPETINGNPVMKIGKGAFRCTNGMIPIKNSVNIKSLIIPNSVTEIGDGAFDGCSKLTNISIPEGVTKIAEWVFHDCEGLTNMIIPGSVTEIGSHAFCGCTGLTDIVIPDSVTIIGSSAFCACTGLMDVVIPDSVTEIGSTAFGNCTCISRITIPRCVTEIEYQTFSGCKGLTDVNIPYGVTKIHREAFIGCKGLTRVTIPESVISIGAWAFLECTSLKSVTIPSSVTHIGGAAFEDCTEVIRA